MHIYIIIIIISYVLRPHSKYIQINFCVGIHFQLSLYIHAKKKATMIPSHASRGTDDGQTYVDYSCSTPLERLARDVETVLRGWHIAEGSDRHVSFGRDRGGGSGTGDDEIEPLTNADGEVEAVHVRLIRSAEPTLSSFPLPHPVSEEDIGSSAAASRVDVPLTLALWDGPPRSTAPLPTASSKIDHPAPQLPLSLMPRSDQRGGAMPTSLTMDLSSLLGIGQHITLTPRRAQLNNSSCTAATSLTSVAETLLTSTVLARRSARKRGGDGRDATSWAKIAAQTPEKSQEDTEVVLDEQHGLASLAWVLQTALNVAASACDCRIPMFGLWSQYAPQQHRTDIGTGDCAVSQWLGGGRTTSLVGADQVAFAGAKRRRFSLLAPPTRIKPIPAHRFPPLIVGQCHPGPDPGSAGGKFFVILASQRISCSDHIGTLHGLGRLLLQHSMQEGARAPTVAVTGARHFYQWKYGIEENDAPHFWRYSLGNGHEESFDLTMYKSHEAESNADAIGHYRKLCNFHVVQLLERASALGRAAPNHSGFDDPPQYPPLWGPDRDPTKAISMSVTWNGVARHYLRNDSTKIGGELTSAVKPSPILLLPLRSQTSRSQSLPELIELESPLLATLFDPLSVRSGEFLVGAKFDIDAPCAKLGASLRCTLAGLIKVTCLDDEALIGHLTNKKALDKLHAWESELDSENSSPTNHLLARSDVGLTTRRLVEAMDWKSMSKNLRRHEDDVDKLINVVLDGGSILDGAAFPSPPLDMFAINREGPMDANDVLHLSHLGAAPPGRLVSVLFAAMASLRTPSLIASAWLAFVEEIRSKWDTRESLPNLGYVVGLDGTQEEYGKRRAKANIRRRRRTKLGSISSNKRLGSKASCAAFLNSSEPEPSLFSCLIDQKLAIFNICVESIMATETGPNTEVRGSDSVDNCFDKNVNDSFDASISSNQSLSLRQGVRCPVRGSYLLETGDQLYAPYLQRTEPFSTDEVMRRREILSVPSDRRISSIQERLEVAHRFQRPKLLSDMRAFKAANPTASFQDFQKWYGNPSNPLEEFECTEDLEATTINTTTISNSNSKIHLESASQAIHALTAMRKFWGNSWEEAEACPASQQETLFDPDVAAARVIHSLDTIHPAHLMNQMLAVNLSSALFVLYSEAGDSVNIPIVKQALEGLEEIVEATLLDLALDLSQVYTARSASNVSRNSLPRFVSENTVASCDSACNAIGNAEVILSRATSLMSKFPGEYRLIQDILLAFDEGEMVAEDEAELRTLIMSAVMKKKVTDLDSHPHPSVREYVLQNLDGEVPCQLSARIEHSPANNEMSTQGGVLLALTKCSRE